MSLRIGDVVFHRPSGEEWMVAAVDGKFFYAAGWPETLALVSDVGPVRAASDAEHVRMVGHVRASAGRRASLARAHTCVACEPVAET